MGDPFSLPSSVRVRWTRHHRIIASQYPPVDLFERLDLTPDEKRALWTLQARTNPRLLQQSGDLRLVRESDMLSGPGATIVMAAFTHIGRTSRFSDGSFGIYYAGHTLETAIRETLFHRQQDARERELGPDEWNMRAYIGQVKKPLYDIRPPEYHHLHTPDTTTYPLSQRFTRELLAQDPDAWGLIYHSVRHPGDDCIAALRPPAVSRPLQGPHLTYVWNGRRVISVYEKSEPILSFEEH